MSRSFGHGPLDFSSMSPVIKGLIVTNVAVFVLQQLVGREMIYLFGLVPWRVTQDLFIWQPITYLFLHAGFMHLLFNLFALWMFGMAVESQWGGREFLKFVLICGVGAGLVNVLVEPSSRAPIIGASGMIYGLLVAFAMLYPESVVYLYFFFPIKAKHMAILFGVMEFMAGASSGTSAVARVAHLAGMLIAYVYIRWWGWLGLWFSALFRELGARVGLRARSGRPPSARSSSALPSPVNEMDEVDRILDKILQHGESSLTDAERAVLQRHSRRGGGNA